jgi:hypothetical protein
LAAQAVLGEAADILHVDQYLSAFRIIKPQKKFQQGRFTRP